MFIVPEPFAVKAGQVRLHCIRCVLISLFVRSD